MLKFREYCFDVIILRNIKPNFSNFLHNFSERGSQPPVHRPQRARHPQRPRESQRRHGARLREHRRVRDRRDPPAPHVLLPKKKIKKKFKKISSLKKF